MPSPWIQYLPFLSGAGTELLAAEAMVARRQAATGAKVFRRMAAVVFLFFLLKYVLAGQDLRIRWISPINEGGEKHEKAGWKHKGGEEVGRKGGGI